MESSKLNIEDVKKYFNLAKNGDRGAIGSLIDLTQNHLFRFCYYLCGNKNLAEDLCQDTYVKVFENIKSIKEDSSFQAWLFKTARNHFLDHVKSPKNTKTKGIEDVINDIAGSDNHHIVLEVRQCLLQLDQDDRALLLMVDLEGLTYEEAAQALNISLEALKSRVFRARKAFLEKYEKK